MNRFIVISSLLLVLALEVYAEGTVVETSFYSQAMGQEKSVRVYLPEGYDTQGWGRYPVIYYLHGAGQMLGHDDFLDVTAALDDLIAAGDIKPVLAVCPDGFAAPYPAAFYTSSVLYGDLEGYMTYDLVNWMDDNYRTIPSHRKRVIMGHSMGGYGALKYWAEHQDLYCCAAAVCGSGLDLPVMLSINIYGVLGELTGPPYYYYPGAGFANAVLFSMSGAFSPNLGNPPYYVDLPLDEYANYISEIWALWMQHNLPQYMQELGGGGPNTPAIYMDAGTQDQFYILPACMAFTDSLDELGIPYEFQVFEGGHFDKLHERFPIAIEFLCSYMHHTWGCSGDSQTGVTTEVFGIHAAASVPGSNEGIISFELLSPGNVAVNLYDMSGRLVGTPLDGPAAVGSHTVRVEGSSLAEGMYFYSISSQGERVTGKLLILH